MQVTRELLALVRRHLEVFFHEEPQNLMKADESVEMKTQRETHQSRLEHLWWQWLAAKRRKKNSSWGCFLNDPGNMWEDQQGARPLLEVPEVLILRLRFIFIGEICFAACGRSRVQRSGSVRIDLRGVTRVWAFVKGMSPTLESSWCNICHPPIGSLQLEYTQYRELSQQLFNH